MKPKRDSLQVMAEVLGAAQDCGQDGIRVSALMRRANLSGEMRSKFIKNLTGSGLINKIEYDGIHTYVITEKGRNYLESYARFVSIAESFGLEM